MKFEWDETKNRSNINKHGISFQDAVTVFLDPFALSSHNEEHSEEEACRVRIAYRMYKMVRNAYPTEFI